MVKTTHCSTTWLVLLTLSLGMLFASGCRMPGALRGEAASQTGQSDGAYSPNYPAVSRSSRGPQRDFTGAAPFGAGPGGSGISPY